MLIAHSMRTHVRSAYGTLQLRVLRVRKHTPRVRISAAEDDDASSTAGGPDPLATELSVEGSELSASSVASLAPLAPGGVRPPALGGGAVGVRWLGTSTKRVSWAEYAEVSSGRQGEGVRSHRVGLGSSKAAVKVRLVVLTHATVIDVCEARVRHRPQEYEFESGGGGGSSGSVTSMTEEELLEWQGEATR